MGIGDSIGKAAENAMEDLAGTSKPTEKMNVPDPTDPQDDVEVHSSLSEGSNAMEAEKEKAPGLKTGAAPGPVSENPFGGDQDADESDGGSGTEGRGAGEGSAGQGSTGQGSTGQGSAGRDDDGGLAGSASAPAGGAGADPGGVSGSAGLPDSNPDELRADPTEGDQDPSTSTGRG